MLVAALVVTLVGFALLVVALITSSVVFAWACIVICLIGFGLLIADVLGLRRGKDADSADPGAASTEVQAPEAAEVAEEQAVQAEAPEAESSAHAGASDELEPVQPPDRGKSEQS